MLNHFLRLFLLPDRAVASPICISSTGPFLFLPLHQSLSIQLHLINTFRHFKFGNKLWLLPSSIWYRHMSSHPSCILRLTPVTLPCLFTLYPTVPKLKPRRPSDGVYRSLMAPDLHDVPDQAMDPELPTERKDMGFCRQYVLSLGCSSSPPGRIHGQFFFPPITKASSSG
jgi:hypothetical protein